MSAVVYPVHKEVTLDYAFDSLRDLEPSENVGFIPIASTVDVEDGVPRINTGTRVIPMSGNAYERLAKIVKVPAANLSNFPKEMLSPLFNHRLSSMREGTSLTAALGEGGVVRYFRKGSPTISPVRILDKITDITGSDISLNHSTFEEDFVRFSVMLSETEREVVPGDAFRFGLTVTTSPSKVTPLEIASYSHRLICTNGAVSTVTNARFRPSGDEDAQNDWLDLAITQAIAAANDEFDRIDRMREISLSDRLSAFLESAVSEFAIPNSVRPAIMEAVIEQQPQSLYDMYNIITDLASNSDEFSVDASIASRLMASASLMTAHPDMCDTCGRVSV